MDMDHRPIAAAAAYAQRCDDFDAAIAERALELGNDAERFLEWIAERDTQLSEIAIKSANTGRRITARAALIANAPTWLREQLLAAETIDDDYLMDVQVEMSNGKSMPADQLLISTAPEWLRAELVDWLSRQSLLESEVREEMWS